MSVALRPQERTAPLPDGIHRPPDAETRYKAWRRHQELCLDWISYHEHQLEETRRVSKLLEENHRREIQRYQRMLGNKP